MYEILGYIYASTDHHFIPSINLIKLNYQAVPYYCDDSVTTVEINADYRLFIWKYKKEEV